AASEKQSARSSSSRVTISISMSETSSATPRETLPVSTTSSTVMGSASAIPCAIERSSTLRAVAVIRPPYFEVVPRPAEQQLLDQRQHLEHRHVHRDDDDADHR